jgi:hypothetical protein
MRERRWQSSLTTSLGAGAVCEAIGNFAEHPLLGEGTVLQTLILRARKNSLSF